jgi:hypothetical protein
MYTEQEMTLEAIRDDMADEMDKHIEDLSDDDKWLTVSELVGNDWTPRQIELFANQAAGWSNGNQRLRVHIRQYHGLSLRRQKTPGELVDTVLSNERSRRQTANWDERRRIDEAKASAALTADEV